MADRDALSDLRTAFNCPAKWTGMKGDDRVRQCSQCNCKVYNISGMTRTEAVNLLETHGEKVCVRFYQRADGQIMTKPCGRARKILYRWQIAAITMMAAIGCTLFTPVYAGAATSPRSEFKSQLRRVQFMNEIIRGEKDVEAIKELEAEKAKYMASMKAAYARLSPEDIDEMGPLLKSTQP